MPKHGHKTLDETGQQRDMFRHPHLMQQTRLQVPKRCGGYAECETFDVIPGRDRFDVDELYFVFSGLREIMAVGLFPNIF